MSQVITLRLPDSSAEEVRRLAGRERRSVSDAAARMIEEWLRQNQFTHIEFRSFNSGRDACIQGRLQVWQVIMVAQGYGMDVQKTAEHLVLQPEQVQAAFSYYRAYPEEIDRALQENNRSYEDLKRLLPQLERMSVPPDPNNDSDGR